MPIMRVLASSPILPPALVLPAAAVAMLVIAAHTLATQRAPMPQTRRRIRTANGVLMLFLTAMLAYALSIMKHAQAGGAASASETREFVIVWMVIMGLLPTVVLLAIFDVLNTVRLHAEVRKRLRLQRKQRAPTVREREGGTSGASAHPPTERDDAAHS